MEHSTKFICANCGGCTGEHDGEKETTCDDVVIKRERPTIHIIGLFHTVPSAKWSHCAFTGKVLRFAKMMKPFGWHIIEYANGESESQADEKVMILSEERLLKLLKRKHPTEFVGKDAAIGSRAWMEFNSLLIPQIMRRAKDGDIICHPFGKVHESVQSNLPKCVHVESGIGYPTTWLPLKIFESSAWMHYHYGKNNTSGFNYNWVIPNYYDLDEWDICLEPDNYILYFGRITPEKGIDTVFEIAKHTKRKIVLCGQGDPTPWFSKNDYPTNVLYKAPIHGRERSKLLGHAYCIIMPTEFIEPFGGSGVEAMLCGTPLIASNYGAFKETIVHGVTGFVCNTLGDWLDAIKAAKTLDRSKIADITRSRFSLQTVGKMYDTALRQIAELSGPGWYSKSSLGLQGEIARELPDEDDSVSMISVKPELYISPPREDIIVPETQQNSLDIVKNLKRNMGKTVSMINKP